MAKSGGGGGARGRGNRPALASGLRYGKSITPSASNLRVGDTIYHGGGGTSSRMSGVITKVNKTTFEYTTGDVRGQPLVIKRPIGNLQGGFVARGTTVYPVE